MRGAVSRPAKLSASLAWQDGRCKTLDAGADGYARAEACVVHLLEAFSARELAEVPLQGHALFVHGTSVNQDGRSSSLTVGVGSPWLHALLGAGMVSVHRLLRMPPQPPDVRELVKVRRKVRMRFHLRIGTTGKSV